MKQHEEMLNEMLELAGINEVKLGGSAVSLFIANQAKEYVIELLNDIDISEAEKYFEESLKERQQIDTALTMVEQIIVNLKSQVNKM